MDEDLLDGSWLDGYLNTRLSEPTTPADATRTNARRPVKQRLPVNTIGPYRGPTDRASRERARVEAPSAENTAPREKPLDALLNLVPDVLLGRRNWAPGTEGGNIADLLGPLGLARLGIAALRETASGEAGPASAISLLIPSGAVRSAAKNVEGLLGKDANKDIARVAGGMVRQKPMPRVAAVDQGRARNMAQVYEGLPTNDPQARRAYDALNKEVAEQYKQMERAGYKVEYVAEDPYKNSAEMMQDLSANKRLRVLKTPGDNFHPYMTPEQNDRFRAVHDWIAHGGGGNQFGPIGEENAYRMHSATLSPEAQRALATETRGQNSWVNFGPNRHLPAPQRPFAEQKAALFPEAYLGDYGAMPPAQPTPAGRPAIVSQGAARQPITPRPPQDLKTPPAVRSYRERNLLKALQGEGGATLTAEGQPFAGTGYAVARPELTAFAQSSEEIRTFLQKPEVQAALREGAYIGKWTDPATGATEINITDILPNETQARRLGLQREQKALGHLQGGQYMGDIDLSPVQQPALLPGPRGEAFTRRLGKHKTQAERAEFFGTREEADARLQALDPTVEPYIRQVRSGKNKGLFEVAYLTPLNRAPGPSGVNRFGEIEPVLLGLGGHPPIGLGGRPTPGPSVWQPTPRGVFDRSAPTIQGTAPVDPRLVAKTVRAEPSELAQAIADSKAVERGLLKDAEEGLAQGGYEWYETGPIKASFEEMGGPVSFDRFNLARGSGSIQNPTHNEVATASALLFGEKRGLDVKGIKKAFKQMHPDEPKLWLSKGAVTNYDRAVEAGAQLPLTPGAAERKVPWYSQGNMGGSLDAMPALDTHERRRLLQLANSDRRIKKLIAEMGLNPEGRRADLVPIQNALDYELLGLPYQRAAREHGLPSTQAFQAARWIGGGRHTGLHSQPQGDFVQTLEDVLYHTARNRGLGTDPGSLQGLWRRAAQGDDILSPIYGKDPLRYLYSGQGSLGF